MSAKTIRVVAMIIFFAVGIPGLIVSSIANNTGSGVTFGLIAAAASLVLLGVTAATTGRLSPTTVTPPAIAGPTTAEPGEVSDAEAEALETHITDLVAAGADEAQVRDLVREAVRLARKT